MATLAQPVIDAATELKARREARRKLIAYAEWTFPSFRTSWHHSVIAAELEKVEWGATKRLMIFVPPRHGKSELASVRFPAKVLGNDPQKQIIHASYAESLSRTFSDACRNTIKGDQHQRLWPCRLLKDNSTEWMIEGKENQRPNFIAAGVGGGISGQGADGLIIDDPIKNAEEAESIVMREKIWDWYKSTARTRLQPGGWVVLIMTRWHEDDLAGKLLALAKSDPTADQWTVLELPATNTAEEGFGARLWSTDGKVDMKLEPYKALWPDAYDHIYLAGTKVSSGPKVWNSLYQQKPKPADGNIIKRGWFRFWKPKGVDLPPVVFQVGAEVISVEAIDLPMEFDEMIQSWDMSFKDTEASAYVAGGVWGRLRADKFLIDQLRERMGFTASCGAVQRFRTQYPEAHQILIEDKANGPAIISALKHVVSGIYPVEPTGSKEARLEAASTDFASLNVYVPHPLYRPWVHDYIEELCAAPNGAFWDQADQTSQAINHMRSKGGGFFEYLRQGAEKKRAEERKIMREDATDALYTDGIDKPTPEQVEAKARYMFGDRYVKGS